MTLALLFALRAQFLMGTVCEISAASPREIDTAFAEARRIEALISTWRDDSELSRVNRREITAPSPELYALLREAMQISAETGGAFDPLIRPLIDAWHTRGEGSVPDDATLAAARQRANPSNATLANGAVVLANGAAFEEGGFGKGYALDRMMALTTGDAVLNFGGQIAVRGAQQVSIAHPLHRDRPLVDLTLRDASLSTSSGSEKAFVVNGRHFSHLIDPATGQALPPRGSVSVIDRSALRADALSTALFVMGPERGLAWARAHGVVAIFISESGEVTWSSDEERRRLGGWHGGVTPPATRPHTSKEP